MNLNVLQHYRNIGFLKRSTATLGKWLVGSGYKNDKSVHLNALRYGKPWSYYAS